jgi:hypothetical protein
MTAPVLSVCIRGFRPASIQTAIASALQQTREDVEVVVADDAGTLEPLVCGFDDPRVVYVRNPHRLGPILNSRAVVAASRGRAICILGDDDVLLPDFTARTLGVLEQQPSVGVVFTDFMTDRDGARHVRRSPAPPGAVDDPVSFCLRSLPHLSSTVIRRDVWEAGERAHPLTAVGSTDIVVLLRSAQLGWDFVHVAEPLVVVGCGPDRVSVTTAAGDLAGSSFSQFSFANPVHQAMQRDMVIPYLHTRCFAALCDGNGAGARRYVQRAAALGARGARHRRLTLLARWPALFPLAHRVRALFPAGRQ